MIFGGVDKRDGKQRFCWYEYARESGEVRWKEHVFGVTSSEGFRPAHGYYCGEMAWGDMDGDGNRDFIFAGHGSGFLGWFENRGNSE